MIIGAVTDISVIPYQLVIFVGHAIVMVMLILTIQIGVIIELGSAYNAWAIRLAGNVMNVWKGTMAIHYPVNVKVSYLFCKKT